MPIVTLARQMGSGGVAIAQDLARRLGYRLIGSEELADAAEAYGYLKPELEEVHEKRPTLVTRFFTMHHKAYLDMLQTIVYDFAAQGNVIIMGRAAPILLRDLPSTLRVHIYCPFEARVDRLMHNEGISREVAEQLIRENDTDRVGYLKYLFDRDIMDPFLYDVMINTAHTSQETAVRIILKALEAKEIREGEAQSEEILGNLILTKRAEEALLRTKQVNPRHITVSVNRPGTVLLRGIVSSEKEKIVAEEAILSVPGVVEVENDLYVTIAPIDHLDFS
jgi:cytidylate kinase